MVEIHFACSPELRHRLEAAAAAQGLSLGDFVRLSLEQRWLAASPSPTDLPSPTDSLYNDHVVYEGECVADTAAQHDAYLYGDKA
jgi:hypothetical protein